MIAETPHIGNPHVNGYLVAIRAIHDMVKAPDFDRKMLLLATQISHQSEMKGVLLAVLESLLKTLKIGSNAEVAEAMTLIRCILKLILGLLVEPAANRCVPVCSPHPRLFRRQFVR